MARERSPNRQKAFDLWNDSQGAIPLKDIARALGVSDSQVRKWKNQDGWELGNNNNVTNGKGNVTNKRPGGQAGNKNAVGNRGGPGAPKGNKYAVGNSGGAAPLGNSNAVSHGFFRKYFPEDALEIMEQLETRSPIDMLWDNIVIQYTAIIRAQQIMFVQDQQDETKVLKKLKPLEFGDEKEWEYQHAWDKQATFLNAQSRAMATLQSLIKQYEDMCNKGLATEEQRLRVEKLKGEISLLEQKANKDDDKPIEIVIKRKGDAS
ncbi:phage terminase small subunit [Brevibacillus formosus]|uniref:phage terminase small subunit n=1 Tax=Brevibacillus formosus TaxID=54913 RepID=UPI003F1C3CDB